MTTGRSPILFVGCGMAGCVALVVGLVVITAVLYSGTRPPPTGLEAVAPKDPGAGEILLTWKGREFREGAVVRVRSWAGTMKRKETGLDTQLSVDAGRVGVVVGIRTVEVGDFGPREVVEVEWARQVWRTSPRFWRSREVGPFESTIHPDYLEPIERE